jgi:hypothetical protein
MRIIKPACCHGHWIDLTVVCDRRRRRIRLGPRYLEGLGEGIEGLGEGTYFIVGSDGGRVAFKVPGHPWESARPHLPAASAVT